MVNHCFIKKRGGFQRGLLYLAGLSFGLTALFSCASLPPEAHYNLAVDYVQKGRLEEAKREYKSAIKADPNFVQAHNNLGALYLRQDRLFEAEREFKIVLSISPNHRLALENLASTYEAMGGKDQTALETWRKALSLESRPEIKIRIARRVTQLESRLSPSSQGSPTLTLFSPTPEESVSGDFVRVEGEASSPVGIDRVTVSVNGEPIGEEGRGIGGIEQGKIPAGAPVDFNGNAKLKEGENKITVVAYDRRGLSTSREIKITRTPAGRFYAKNWGVVIGINQYERWPGLEYAVNDANSVADKLHNMGFEEVIKLLDKEATRERILALLGTELPQRVGKDDLVFIFFAGHGQTEELANGRQKGYIIPVDGSVTDYFSTAISMEDVREFSERIPAKHIYYAMDACYSGLGFMRAMGINPTVPGYLDKVTRIRSVQMVTAGGKGEQVIERGGHGLFTQYMLRALDGEADMDNDGVVTATEMGAFLRPQVSNASDNRQTPQYGRLDGEGEVVFLPQAK